MNSLFQRIAKFQRVSAFAKADLYLGTQGAQTLMYSKLRDHEKKKRRAFMWLHTEHKSDDILEKALARALGNLENGSITLADYYKLKDKIDDLKKIRFSKNYDGYRVATDIGATRERELYILYDQIMRNERGELAHKLWKDRIELDPQAKGIIGNL